MSDDPGESTIDLKMLRSALRDPSRKSFKGKRFSRYDLLSEIGRGAMGVVFRARHRELGSPVALKLLAAQDSEEARGRFKREGRVLAKINHENVVNVSDLGTENGISFLAMELIEGRSLQDELQEHKAKRTLHSYERAVEITLKIARALQHCHEVGAIHRDVKPHNILIEHGTGRPVLTDFGLVKKDPAKMGQSANISGAVSAAGTILGTPSYMSPEQFEPDGRFGKVGPKSDVYGLGAVLFSMLTGVPPFQASNVVELYGLVMDHPPPLASSLREGVPEALDALCDACLAKTVDERISMAEVVERLEKLHEDKSSLVSGRPGAGLRHAFILIAIFAVLAGVHVAFIQPELGRRLWRLLVGQTEGAPAEGDETTPSARTEEKTAEQPKEEPTDPAIRKKLADLEAKAERGDPRAKVKLGRMLLDPSQGVPADPERAIRLLTEAAGKGSTQAMFELGVAHKDGKGVGQDGRKAVEWFQKAAEGKGLHSLLSMLWLGQVFEAGLAGVEKDPQAALRWFRRAVAEGDADSRLRKDAQQRLEKLLEEHPQLRNR